MSAVGYGKNYSTLKRINILFFPCFLNSNQQNNCDLIYLLTYVVLVFKILYTKVLLHYKSTKISNYKSKDETHAIFFIYLLFFKGFISE